MIYPKQIKSVMVVSESGIHIVVDDILSPKETLKLIKDLKNALFQWSKLTGKRLDDPECH